MPKACCTVWAKVDEYEDTWSVDDLRYYVEVASVHCEKCRQNLAIIDAKRQLVRDLAKKVEAAKPIVKRGNIHVDFRKCEIEIVKDINFENRKPPDTSATILP